MVDLLLKNHAPNGQGLVHRVTPESAGWGHVGFELYRLEPGQGLEASTGERELCLVLVAGKAKVRGFGEIGERMGPFENKKPYAVYLPKGASYQLEATTPLELALCSAPGGGSYQPRLIGPDHVAYSKRGKDTNTRHVYDILPESEPAHSLLVVEVITPSGCWSSYPSHKHDTDNLPHESELQETYYHRLDPAQGFAFQRVYTDDGSLDETMCVHDGDVTLVPKGYHPCGTAHGYDLYYLNVMAGPKRIWRFNTEACHRWLL
ncbi:MAG TPA: 5-deoxy-glucuronate isomerase [Geminicoccaceae bacterium]|nr:5-deoxy-glucuronate isomerase [Geminicoccaceae bacterium]